MRLPSFLPDSYGLNLALFSDFGTVGHLDSNIPLCPIGGQSCVKDNLAMRASAGLAIAWKSPFGPITIDLGVPFLKTTYDKSQIIYFSAGTGL
jgi:outer membrane protein insertion porin family